jgi:predicted  nucleic acid-binding Zn-ribbon protein
MQGTGALEKLNILEERIAQTSERFAQLKDQYQALQEQKDSLEREMDRLRNANQELTERIGNLKTSHDRIVSSLHKDEVKKRLDRVLEKLGELQL